MIGPVNWDECWRQLNDAFIDAAEHLRECNPLLWYQTGRRTSDRWPFEAWVQFSRVKDPARVEDIVVFFSVKRDGESGVTSMDISTGEGVVLTDGPSSVVPLDGRADEQSALLNAVVEAKRFLIENIAELREALC